MRRIQMERKLNKSVAGASREGLRAYARGRMYDPDRYPSFPYQDPNELILAKLAQIEEAKASKGKKKAQAAAPAEPEAQQPAAQEVPETVQAPEAPAPEAEVAEEAFVEESFLEEPEGTEEE